MRLLILKGPSGVRFVEHTEEKQTQELIIGRAVLFDKDQAPIKRNVGVGDLLAAVLASIGFTKWWNTKFKGCKCKSRRAALNYLKMRVPEWLNKWVKKNADS